ncbi:hypothetical protein F7725_001345 [Dissostichus mawsoni]|uniref:Uncharacterized protein n=1 Tax=Dissostichus mawsoni TaxID=36200 RepID=A0A7J5ZHH5_DISMA|nr:hypothetical protein F7725_001345 [Dissostichus mawsoni]
MISPGQLYYFLAALQHLIMGSVLLKCAAADLGLQWGGWALAAALRTEKFYDLAGSGTFILLAHLSRVWGGASHLRQNVQTGLTRDFPLHADLEGRPGSQVQQSERQPGDILPLWVFMTLLPTLMLNSEKRDSPLGPRDFIGWGLWGLGFATEAIADQQKWIFKSDPGNAWGGLWLSASSVMKGPLQLLSATSPLFVWFLLRHVSGIPILEKQALKKWGADPQFQDYIRNTPLLWPWPKCF